MTCRQCGSDNPSGKRFCGDCGADIRGLGATGLGVRGKIEPLTPNPVTPNPLSYTPRHLAEKILTSRSGLEGERKQVTVLFADVKGSMELEEQLDPEEWSQIMSRFFTLLSQGVEREEARSEEHTSELQSLRHLVCRLLLEKKKKNK